MSNSDPSVCGAANALLDTLRRTFPSVAYDTIRAITIQHSSDPQKCFDLVRLESNIPPSTAAATSSTCAANGGEENRRRNVVTVASRQPQGSYIIRRAASPHITGCLVRDTRSCTPPRCPPSGPATMTTATNVQQQHGPSVSAGAGAAIRPGTLSIHSTLQPQSPLAQRRTSTMVPSNLVVVDGAAAHHSCPGTPTDGQNRVPALKINYGGAGGSQIMLTPSAAVTAPGSPGSAGFITTGGGGGRPAYFLTRTISHGPPTISTTDGVSPNAAATSSWHYDRRPSFADVGIMQNQRSPSTSSSGEIKVTASSVENINSSGDGVTTPAGSGAGGDRIAVHHAPSPNIKIHLDHGGAVVGGGAVPRPRPRVTFTPLVTMGYHHRSPTLTFSVRQSPPPHPYPQALVYDPLILAKSTASTQAQVEECLKTVLHHQRARLSELRRAAAKANVRLEELRADVASLEQDVDRPRKLSHSGPPISDDAIDSLRTETRELQGEIQSMMRELNLYRSSEDDEQADDEGGESDQQQWSCSLCKFRNHPDLPMCEICEMPRITGSKQPGGT